MKRGNLDTQTETHIRRIPSNHKHRDWGDASTSQGMPKIASNPPGARREAGNVFSLIPLRWAVKLANTLISNFSIQNCEVINFCRATQLAVLS